MPTPLAGVAMKPENRALAVVVLAIALVAGVGGTYILSARHFPLTIVSPAGTRFLVAGINPVAIAFLVPENGTLTGIWLADTPVCAWVILWHLSLIVTPPISSVCAAYQEFSVHVGVGQYSLLFSTLGASQNPPSANGSATVTVLQTIQVVYS